VHRPHRPPSGSFDKVKDTQMKRPRFDTEGVFSVLGDEVIYKVLMYKSKSVTKYATQCIVC
jgi:hypothetical protein